jgi:hypothetical protein
MAEVKKKSEPTEKAIARLFNQMDKDTKRRQWTPVAYGKLILYVAEAHGAKFPNGDSRDRFVEVMKDSDFSFSSNFKKYAAERGELPKADEYAETKFE